MIWFLAMAGLALAQQQPTTGHILFDVSPGAEIVVFPRSKPDVIELGLYRNRVPLEPQLEELRVPLVADIDALSVGSGTSFITIYVERDDVAIQTTTEGGQITFTLQPGRIAPSPPPPTPTLQGILENLDYRRPARPPNVALSPLRGDASASLPDPATLLLDIPPWFITTAETRYGLILRSTRASMANIDSYREVLTESEDPQEIEKARYRMANAYLALQMPREAGYYARKMLADPHDVPTEVAELLAAQSDIAARRWDEARKHCVTASEAGARTAETLRCLGVVSIATGYPSPSHVARALLVQSGDPNDHLLAIQLFQKDHRHKEVIEPLEQVIEALETPPPRAWLALGDALYMTLDLPGAMLAWSKVRPGDDIHPAARMRRRMGRLAEGTRADWAQEIPNLEALSERDGREGAEAAYLLGQIAQSQGDVHAAAGHYAAMWKDHRDLSLSADVPERLLTVCNERLNQLHRAERTVDEVAVFHGCWHKDLDLLSSSTETLERMAQVMSDLGLSEAALKLQQRALQVHTVTGRENSNALLGLAELYTLSDRFRESLDTLTYLDKYAPSKDKVRRQLAQANAHLGLKDLDSAEKAYRRAIAAAPEQALPRRSLGLLLARNNRCTEAVTYLKDDTNPDAALAGTRCLLELGEPTLAHATATDVLAQADNEWTAEHAAWLASVAALDAVPTPPLPPPESPVTPLWRELLAEEWAIASLKRRLFATEEQ